MHSVKGRSHGKDKVQIKVELPSCNTRAHIPGGFIVDKERGGRQTLCVGIQLSSITPSFTSIITTKFPCHNIIRLDAGLKKKEFRQHIFSLVSTMPHHIIIDSDSECLSQRKRLVSDIAPPQPVELGDQLIWGSGEV